MVQSLRQATAGWETFYQSKMWFNIAVTCIPTNICNWFRFQFHINKQVPVMETTKSDWGNSKTAKSLETIITMTTREADLQQSPERAAAFEKALLSWDRRKEIITSALLKTEADVICLQEVVWLSSNFNNFILNYKCGCCHVVNAQRKLQEANIVSKTKIRWTDSPAWPKDFGIVTSVFTCRNSFPTAEGATASTHYTTRAGVQTTSGRRCPRWFLLYKCAYFWRLQHSTNIDSLHWHQQVNNSKSICSPTPRF